MYISSYSASVCESRGREASITKGENMIPYGRIKHAVVKEL